MARHYDVRACQLIISHHDGNYQLMTESQGGIAERNQRLC